MNDQKTGIVEYDPIERTLQEFRAKYGSRAFDVATPEGFADAKAVAKEGRKALIELEKIRKAIKEPALRRCQQIDADAKRLAAGISAIFEPIARIADAEERRQEQARQEAARQEALRVAKIRERIERLDPVVPFDADSVAILSLLNYVRATPVDDSFQEFEDDAFFVRAAALNRLQAALDVVQAREREAADHAAAIEAERAESARLRERVEAQERNAAAAAAAASAPAAGELFPVEQIMDDPLLRRVGQPATFCRSCWRQLQDGATSCSCGWTTVAAAVDAGDDRIQTVLDGRPPIQMTPELVDDMNVGRPPLSAPGALLDRMKGIDGRAGAIEANMAARTLVEVATGEAEGEYSMAAPDPVRPVPLDVFDDRANDCVRVCGVVYSGDFFRVLATSPVGCWIRVQPFASRVVDGDLFAADLFPALDELAGFAPAEPERTTP